MREQRSVGVLRRRWRGRCWEKKIKFSLLYFLFFFLFLSCCSVRAEVDIEFLKRNTEYQRGIRPTDAHVRHFWTSLEEMSQKERQLFLRFVSGQSRLWSEQADFIMKFKLMPSAVDNDIVLPVRSVPVEGKRTRNARGKIEREE